MRRLFFAFALLGVLAVPYAAWAQNFVPCGGDDQPSCQTCHVVELLNNVTDWLIIILGTVAAIIIVYAGFKLVTAGGNSGVRADAKEMLINLLIGYVIVLAGWLLVDTAMRALINTDTLGVWNQIQCTNQPVPTSGTAFRPEDELDVVTSRDRQDVIVTRPDGSVVSGGSGVLCPPASPACSVSALQRYGLTASQAAVMSCIAMTESSGNPSTPPYNIANPGSNSTACGTFQIVGTTWRRYATGACADHRSNCQNAQCNAQVMAALVRANGYRDWTCPNCNSRAAACVSRYSQ